MNAKDPIALWDKMKHHMRGYFLPPNYTQVLYQLQSLHQGDRCIDDYTEEFHHLVARNNVKEDEEQLVAKYKWPGLPM